jgi:RHS repeat-associated protein
MANRKGSGFFTRKNSGSVTPKNQTVSFTYDVLGRVLTTTDRTGKVTTQTYTNMGQVATVTDAESRATGYGYNVLGQRISTTYSDSGQQTIDSFDAAGRPLQITKPSGRKHHLTYNFLGNVTQIQFKNSAGTVTETQTMTYDAYGRETGVASSQYSASTAKTYNDLGQLASESTTYSSQTYTVGYAYDAQGRLNQMTYPSGKVAAYPFDARQQLKTISWQGTQVEDRSYNDIGLLTGVDRAYVDETRTYTAAGRVNTINSNNVGSMTYSYDANGNVTGETLSGNMANYSFTTVSGGNSGYDGEDRFMRFIRSGVSEDIQLTRSHIGNISNVNLNGGNTARGFNNAHGLTTVTGGVTQTYDSDGNTTKLHTNVTASWDDAGRTKNTNTPTGASAGIPGFNEYGYVGGLRIWKKITRSGSVVEHRVTVHAGPNVIAEYNAGATASSPVQEYVYADQIDSLVLIHRSNGTKLGVSRNRQWSVVALHDLANGNVVERYAYEMTGKRTIYAANGTTVRSTSSYGNHFGYTSRWHDEESGLMYFRARYYNPLTGEFLSRDPLEFVDGMSLYRGYFPINGVDPTGKLAWFIPIIAWFVVGAGIEIAIQMWNGDEFNILAILASGAITAIPGRRWGATGFKALRIRELLKELRQNIFEWRYTFGKILDGTSKMHFRGPDLIYHRQKVRELIRQVREAISDFWATVRAADARSAARSATTNAIKSLTGNNTDSENAKSAESKSNPVSGPQRPYVYSQPIIDGLGQNRFVLCIPTTGQIIEVFPGDALPPGTPVPPQWPGHPGHGPIYQPIPQLPPGHPGNGPMYQPIPQLPLNIPNNGDPSRRPGIPQLLPSIPSHGFPPFQPPPNIGS